MSFLLPLIAGCVLLAEPDKPVPLHYLRPDMGKYTAAGEVTIRRTEDGTVVISRTERPDEQATVTLRYDGDGKLTSADAVQAATRKGVTLTLGEKGAGTINPGGISEFFKPQPANPVVTAGPDWLGTLTLLRRYDTTKGGKQEFAGFWIDPVQGLEKQTYTIERKASETVTVKDKEVKLDRYRIKLRGGEYTAWADLEGRVVRVQALAPKAVPIVLDGFEDATRGLKP